jgi:hypothetical protein
MLKTQPSPCIRYFTFQVDYTRVLAVRRRVWKCLLRPMTNSLRP